MNLLKLEELINRNYNQLNKNDLLIWEYISTHRKECENMAIDELARHCSLSRSTVLRFSQKLSLSGYGELKVMLKYDNSNSKKPITSHINIIFRTYHQFMKRMQHKDFTPIVQLIDQADNLYVYGSGEIQTVVAKEIKRIFLQVKKIFYNIDTENEVRATVNAMTDQDLVILISLSGESRKIIGFAKQLRIKNIPFISITTHRDNSLASLSTESLYVDIPHLTGPALEAVTNPGSNYFLSTYFMMTELIYLRYVEYLMEGSLNHESN